MLDEGFLALQLVDITKLDEEGKNLLRMVETSAAILKPLSKEIKNEFIRGKLDFEEKASEW